MSRARKALFAAVGTWLGLRAFAALRPTAFPYLGWPILDLPRPLITPGRLLDILSPSPGERVLEVGPGSGFYSVPVAARLMPGGVLEIVDVRQGFLDHTVRRARKHGLANVEPTLSDGTSLPYPDGRFDAAYLVSVLGELPDPQAGLRELRRVLRPGGRLVVGEIFIDPDFPRLSWLTARARDAGFRLERRTGGGLAYFARFTTD